MHTPDAIDRKIIRILQRDSRTTMQELADKVGLSISPCHRRVKLLEERGVRLGHPYSSGIEGSRHTHMRELRVQSGGRPIRVFYAFDPRRAAILPIGGDKTGDDRFYERFVPVADRLYDEHLEQLRKAGLSP